jgi:hypothetical protein
VFLLAILTNLGRDWDQEVKDSIVGMEGVVWKTLDQGAATSMVAAFDPKLGGE